MHPEVKLLLQSMGAVLIEDLDKMSGGELLVGVLDGQIDHGVQNVLALFTLGSLGLQKGDKLSVVLWVAAQILMQQIETAVLRVH